MLSIENAARMQSKQAYLLITPELSSYRMTSTKNINQLIQAGYDAAKEVIHD
jgi:hypothetical protein